MMVAGGTGEGDGQNGRSRERRFKLSRLLNE